MEEDDTYVWRDTARRDEPVALVQFIYLHHRLKWPSNIVLLTLGGCIGVKFFSTARVRSTGILSSSRVSDILLNDALWVALPWTAPGGRMAGGNDRSSAPDKGMGKLNLNATEFRPPPPAASQAPANHSGRAGAGKKGGKGSHGRTRAASDSRQRREDSRGEKDAEEGSEAGRGSTGRRGKGQGPRAVPRTKGGPARTDARAGPPRSRPEISPSAGPPRRPRAPAAAACERISSSTSPPRTARISSAPTPNAPAAAAPGAEATGAGAPGPAQPRDTTIIPPAVSDEASTAKSSSSRPTFGSWSRTGRTCAARRRTRTTWSTGTT